MNTSPVPRAFSHSQTTARQRKVIDLLANGVKPVEIAKQLGGITENGVRKLIARALKAQAADLLSTGAFERAAGLYLLWNERLMAGWMPYALPRVHNGETVPPDKDAADVVIKLMKQFADVYGLNAPIKVQPVDPATANAPRPEGEVVAAVMAHLDELSERMGLIAGGNSAPVVVLEGETVSEQVQP